MMNIKCDYRRNHQAVVDLVGGAICTLNNKYVQQNRDVMAPEQFLSEFQTVTVKTHRASGMTTAAEQLCNRYNCLIITANSVTASMLTTKHNIEFPRIIQASRLASDPMNTLDCIADHVNRVQHNYGPAPIDMIIVDPASMLYNRLSGITTTKIPVLPDDCDSYGGEHWKPKIETVKIYLPHRDLRHNIMKTMVTLPPLKNTLLVELG